jgi:hypothetical protein
MAARITGNITEHSRAIAWYSRSPQQMDAITIEVSENVENWSKIFLKFHSSNFIMSDKN